MNNKKHDIKYDNDAPKIISFLMAKLHIIVVTIAVMPYIYTCILFLLIIVNVPDRIILAELKIADKTIISNSVLYSVRST